MDSHVVKVQNKGAMRRLTLARGEQEFSYEQFQSKIRELFLLPTSAEFELTYVDKDGDVVTMGEDEDLKDALVLQKLNPLRVAIENLQGDTDDVKINSPLVQNELNSGEVKEPHQQRREGEQIPQYPSKLLPVVDSVANTEPIVNTGENSIVPEEKEWTIIDKAPDSNPSNASSPASGTSVNAVKVDLVANAEPVIESAQTSPVHEEKASAIGDETPYTSRPDSSFPASGTSVDAVEVDPAANAEPVIDSTESSTVQEEKVSAIVDETPDANRRDAPAPASETSVDATKETSPEVATTTEKKRLEAEKAKDYWGRQVHFGVQCDGCGMTPIAGPRFKSCKKPNYDLCLECFKASDPQENEYVKLDRSFYRIGCPAYPGRLCRRPHQRMCRRPDQCQNMTPDSEVQNCTAAATSEAGNKDRGAENSARVLHEGVQCDECGEVPIEGPRFKSSTRFNYDLCHRCFEKSGSNASEYTRIEQPFVHRGAHPLMMRHLLNRTFPRGLQHPLSPRWIWVLNQMVPVVAVDQVGAAEKAPTAGNDVKVGGVNDKPQVDSAASKVDAEATPSASKQDEITTEERAGSAKVERKVVQIPVIWADTRQAASGTSSTPETQTKVPPTESGGANNSVKKGEVEGKVVQGRC